MGWQILFQHADGGCLLAPDPPLHGQSKNAIQFAQNGAGTSRDHGRCVGWLMVDDLGG